MRAAELRKIALFITILSLAVSVPWGIQQWTAKKQAPVSINLASGTLLPRGRAVESFYLETDEQQTFTQQDLMGKWTFAFFGYADCPSICPRSLALFSEMWRSFPGHRPHPSAQFVFITLNPEEDTPQKLHAFVKAFHPDFMGLTGEPRTIQRLGKNLGIYSLSTEGVIDHSATLLLFSPDGRLHALFSPPHQPEQLKADIQTIMNRFS